MDHRGYAEQVEVNQQLFAMSKVLLIPLIATNDLHYVAEGDAHAHEILLCVQTQDTIQNPKRFQLNSPEFFFT